MTLIFGQIAWTSEDILKDIAEFLQIYPHQSPIKDNQGGMKAPHAFATWWLLRQLKPKVVIESGVWKGQGTWLIAQALPEAEIHAIDPNPRFRQYSSPQAKYYSQDLTKIDWSALPKEETLLFIDDHQNALERLKFAQKAGFKHIIFEDNYMGAAGDCYSLKKAWHGLGFQPNLPKHWLLRLKYLWKRPQAVAPNQEDRRYLESELALYYEFPPVVKPSHTRWGDTWTEEAYPTAPALYAEAAKAPEIFVKEAQDYTWLCYARLR